MSSFIFTGTVQIRRNYRSLFLSLVILSVTIAIKPIQVRAQTPEPVVAIHVSELTQALETLRAQSPTPTGPGTTGYEWWTTAWHYRVMPESLKESLRSDGTPFVEVSDADIVAGRLQFTDGSPRYPILISLASEAIADNEIAPLRDYVAAGGNLFVGSSAFTRHPDGTTRGDFALANELGLHMVTPSLQNWYQNLYFTKVTDHPLVRNIPSTKIAWRMPISSDEIPLGTSPNYYIHGYHWVFQVSADSGTTVIANGDSGPLLATRQYGNGNLVYHGAMQPLVGHTIYDPSLYAYLIYRQAIEWAFEAYNLPLIRVSPWRYGYNAAFIVRHDFENKADLIRSIESSAAYEKGYGVRGDYYFCTGTLRDEMWDESSVVASLRRAVINYGATIGSHNGGLKNPVNPSLHMSDFDYWHWGPDEVLDMIPSGYTSGKAYAQASVSASFHDIEGWLAGVDNGRAGCNLTDTCPRLWAAPFMNSTREGSRIILRDMGSALITAGEEKVGPYPHRELSYENPVQRFPYISVPTSDWYVGSEVPGALDMGHTSDSMRAAVDFYYNLGAQINLYGHLVSSDSTLMGQYVKYCTTKPRMWSTNTTGIADWWQVRSGTVVMPAYSVTDTTVTAQAAISGATDSDTAIDVTFPNSTNQIVNNLQVFIDGSPADPADYRMIGNTVKVRVGAAASSAKVQYALNNPLPTTMALSPSTTTAGGAAFTLTVTGTGFVTGSVVQWNGDSRATTYVSSTQLTASILAADIAAAGTVTVTVDNPSPGGGISNGQTFTVTVGNPLPTTTALSPSTAIAGGADFMLTVTGSGFVNGSVVQWDGVSRTTTYVSSTRLTATIPATDIAAAGMATVTVFNPTPGGGTSNIQLFTINTSDTLFSDDFTRSPGIPNPLFPWVTSMGTWTVTAGVMKGSGNQNQYSYAYYSTTPQWADYTVKGSVQIPAGSFGGGIGGRVVPATGAHYGAWIYPTGSAGGSNVLKLWKFRGWTDIGTGVPMQQINLPVVGTGWHTLQMTFMGSRILVYYDGELKIDVTDNNFDSRAPYVNGGISVDWWTWSLPYTMTVDDITVSAISLPTTANLSPSSAYAGGADFTLTVTGSGFVNGSVVQWNGASRPTTYVSATQLTAAIPAADIAGAGTATVTVVNPVPGGGTSNGQTFTITAADNPVPAVTSLSPSTATAGGAAFTLAVTGSGFVNGSALQWNGASRPTTYVSATQLTAEIPAADIAGAGTATVTVVNPVPGGGTSSGQTFTITAADNPVPAVTSLSPATATADGAAFTLAVTGSGFVNGSVVQWNGASRPTTYVSATQLTAAIPAADIAAAGTATVTVVNPVPGGGTSNSHVFTITNPVPTTTSLTPSSKPAGSKAFNLTVYGTGFIPGSVVRWNGANRTTTYISPTQLKTRIYASDVAVSGTAQVTVFTPAPGGGISNARIFTIQ